MKCWSKYRTFHSWRCIWKYRLRNGDHLSWEDELLPQIYFYYICISLESIHAVGRPRSVSHGHSNDRAHSTNWLNRQPFGMRSITADSGFASSQWEMALLCNDVSHLLDASLESALSMIVLWLSNSLPSLIVIVSYHYIFHFAENKHEPSDTNSFDLRLCVL